MTLRAGLGKLVGAALAGTLLVIALVAAAPAAAKPCHKHHGHGNSEVSQYLENVPGPCGDQNVGGGGSGDSQSSGGGGGSSSGGGGGSSALPSSSVQGLEKFGAAGAATANYANATSPGVGHGGNGQGGSGNGSGSGSSGSGSQAGGSGTDSAGVSGDSGSSIDTGNGSVVGALASLVTGGSDQGIGPLLPILLIAILLGGLGLVALRRGYTQSQ